MPTRWPKVNLGSYFKRIGFRGDAQPTMATLRLLVRHHVLSVPFENIDVLMGRSLTTDAGEAFEKIVDRGRGGWCYEQNGLFGSVLGQMGFDVIRVAGAVRSDERGQAARNNHLCLLVREPERKQTAFLVDVGFGGSMIAPIELAECEHSQEPFRLALRKLDEQHWRFSEATAGDDSIYYDFAARPADESSLAAKCEQLQQDPQSGFVQNLVVQRRLPSAQRTLLGRVLTTRTINDKQSVVLETAEELVNTLSERFGLQVPEVADLWPKIVQRHKQWSQV